MRLDEVIRSIAITDRRGYFDTEVTGVTADSRQVKPGFVFAAVRGLSQDGHAFISEAVSRGAAAIIAEEWSEEHDPNQRRPNIVLVPSARRALAVAAANYYEQPSRRLLVAGVTGTNGKTTVTYALESIMRAASKKVGVIGTVDAHYDGGSATKFEQTTPNPVALQAKLAEMAAAGVSHVAMEVSSHALDQERVAGVHFKVAGFTNLSQDHLDYHQDMERYFAAKARLFSECLRKSRARGRMAVVNVDDPRGAILAERWGGKTLKVSLDPKSDADVVALEAVYGLDGTRATVRTAKGTWSLSTPLVGAHNLQNVLIAVGMALSMGFSKARICAGLESCVGAPGRLERIADTKGRRVFVDYAHTPDALTKVLSAIRPHVSGRLLVVFGCGGDRDRQKRALMGKAVGAFADIALITNDNQRTEDPQVIAQAIERGLTEGGWSRASEAPARGQYVMELDRARAIHLAVNLLQPDDVLIIAGKGHEDYQLLGKRKVHFDDREVARHALAGVPLPPPLRFDDRTGEVEVEQVVEVVDVENSAIIEESDAVSTQSVDASSIVEAVELDPEIVEESAEAKPGADPPGVGKT